MKKSLNREFIESILTSLLLLVIGILLLIFPTKTLAIISYIIGGIIALAGIAGLFRYFLKNDDSKYTRYGLAYGIVLLVVACFFFFKQEDVAKIMPFALGVYMIIKSALKLEYTIKLKQNKNSNWKVTLLLLGVSLLIGLLLIFNPFKGAEIITQIIGAIIIFYAIIDLAETYLVKCNLKDDVKKVIEEIPVVVSEKVEKVVEKAKEVVEDVKEEIEEAKEEIKEKTKKTAPTKKTTAKKTTTTKKPTTAKTTTKKVAEAKTEVKKTTTKKTTTAKTTPKKTTTKKSTKKEEPTA